MNRDDLGVEASLNLRAGRPLLAAQGERVLLLAADVILLGQPLGRLPHHHLGKRAEEAVLVHRVDERLVPHAITPSRPGQQVGHAAHRLHPAGQHHLRISVAHGAKGEVDRLQAAGAGHVEGGRRDLRGDACAPRHLPRDVGPGPRLASAAEEHVVHLGGGDAGAAQRFPGRGGPELGGTEGRERATEPSDRCPHGAGHDDVPHAPPVASAPAEELAMIAWPAAYPPDAETLRTRTGAPRAAPSCRAVLPRFTATSRRPLLPATAQASPS